jgi:hypothetical protein
VLAAPIDPEIKTRLLRLATARIVRRDPFPRGTATCRRLREVRHRAGTGQQAHSGQNEPGEWATPRSVQTATGTGLEQRQDDQQPVLTTSPVGPLAPQRKRGIADSDAKRGSRFP